MNTYSTLSSEALVQRGTGLALHAPQEQRRRLSGCQRGRLRLAAKTSSSTTATDVRVHALSGSEVKSMGVSARDASLQAAQSKQVIGPSPSTATRRMANKEEAPTTSAIQLQPEQISLLDQLHLVRRRLRGGWWMMTGPNRQRVDLLVNQIVVSTLVLGAAFKLGTVDVGETYSRNWTLMEYILVMPAHNLEAYLASVASHPVLTKAATSCVAYGIGDFLTQFVQGRRLGDVRLARVARSAVAGLIVHGPLCHYWMLWADSALIASRQNTRPSSKGGGSNMVPSDKCWLEVLAPHSHGDVQLAHPGRPQTSFCRLCGGHMGDDSFKNSNQDKQGQEAEQRQCVIEDFSSPVEELIITQRMENQVCVEVDGEMLCYVPDHEEK
eukprot:CAMPEP_0114290890 /NCGR_PEP_ID=MMETSP0059-20121206/8190_1 /TAXON_ID=36894 /ORGANISM="Pyramimonas parkeae, Strain CCMP726" /LENGTH=381 /DNA_ID=CAMNT_0001412343 /DNA_START=241 /DNA_END=1387 /DNA_ORIENTATION=-